jgi:ubiquinone/menaquinone biosynthesis C-methylase UbiE
MAQNSDRLADVYQVEMAKWNAVAANKVPDLKPGNKNDNFQKYADRVSTMVGVNAFLGDLRGKSVLEYGCGLGAISLLLAQSGAKVTAFDLSAYSVHVADQRARINNVRDRIDLAVAPGEALPFADASFDVVFGKAILHHLDVNLGWYEVYRVLKPGGKAAFVEPMGMNPVLKFVRNHVPYPHKNPRGADRPLNYDEIHAWGQRYSQFTYREIQLFSMLERGLGFNRRLGFLRRLDDTLLERVPFLRRYCRYVVMCMVK